MNILIVETDPLTADGLEETLRALEYESCCSVSPECSVPQLASYAPDLVLVGPNLEERALQECLHKLKIIDTFLPVLVFSENNGFLNGSAWLNFQGVHALRADANSDDISRIIEEALEQNAERAMGIDFPAGAYRAMSWRSLWYSATVVSGSDCRYGWTDTASHHWSSPASKHPSRNFRSIVDVAGPMIASPGAASRMARAAANAIAV